LRDLADAAETYPAAHWPVQITQALQGDAPRKIWRPLLAEYGYATSLAC
jgi:hypothetical protein